MTAFEIGNRRIGPGQRAYVIAEAGVNHNGSVELARRLVDAAAAAGADAVKFQVFSADALVGVDAPKAEYQTRSTGGDESQYQMVRRLELSHEAFVELAAHAAAAGIQFLATPFDPDSADLLERLDVPAYKVASGELTNLPLLRHLAAKGRPIVLSTGMSNLDEIEDALRAVREAGSPPVALLQCVTEYPADPRDVNLRAMETLRQRFGVPVGYSDHTLGIEVPLAAAALGAVIIEKHFTLDRGMAGPDHAASLEPDELRRMVDGVRTVEAAMGSTEKRPSRAELGNAAVARRSLIAAMDLEPGTTVTEQHLGSARPGTGISPARADQLIGRRVRVAVPRGAMLALEMFD